jgi:hypothetical protein
MRKYGASSCSRIACVSQSIDELDSANTPIVCASRATARSIAAVVAAG